MAGSSDTSDPAVLVEIENGIATLTFNRPDKRNMMTPELLEAFVLAVDQVRGDD